MLILTRTLFPSKVQMRDNSFAFLRGYLHFHRISKQEMQTVALNQGFITWMHVRILWGEFHKISMPGLHLHRF